MSFKFEAWPTEFRSINQYFGANPHNYARFGLPGHEGLDIMAPDGSKVFCVAPGVVHSVRHELTGHNYGCYVRVNHADNYQTTYAHLRQALVAPGQPVQAGTLLGLADNSGNSFGSHLHLTLKKLDATFENWPNNIHDPTPFILPLLGWQRPAGPYVEGWAYTQAITLGNGLAQANDAINLRSQPSVNGPKLALVPAGTIMIVNGDPHGQYTPVLVSVAAIGLPDPTPKPPPPPPPPPDAATVDGWGFADYLTVSGSQAVVGPAGINLRAQASRTAPNIGLVRGGSTVALLGARQGEYFPVQVRQSDFMGPVNLPPAPAPVPAPGPGGEAVPDTVLGWAWTKNVTINGGQAVVGPAGINFRAAADQSAAKLGVVKEGAITTVAGPVRGEYVPVRARAADILDLVSPLPLVAQPDPFPPGSEPPPPTPPVPDTTPGWVFTSQMVVKGDLAEAGQYGLNLREGPRRDARAIGFVPAGATMIITGPAQGEYTPVRVDDAVLQPPFGTAVLGTPPTTPAASPAAGSSTTAPAPAEPAAVDPPALGRCRLGLHASADPVISEAELQEFAALRPGIIKVLSFHGENEIRRLALAHPTASWVVRAFLDFGGRVITPDQFLNDTLPDTRRALNVLAGRDVVVELHNEPNTVKEGLNKSWNDGAGFTAWWLELLDKYRRALPGVRFLYPGLSPGPSVSNVRQDHIQFLEASRAAVDAADGLAVHAYWSAVFPMQNALTEIDDYISRFRFKPIWVTEASNNKGGTPVHIKGQQYLQFWQALQQRATVQGVTYFVASASDPAFAEEVWVGRNLGALVGRR